MQKTLVLALVALSWPSFSYSESIAPYYGYTPNAAGSGLTWGMNNVLPTVPGLDINAIIYSYRIQKQTEDSVTVNVQNENALGSGYIFRETDEWLPGSLNNTQINKTIPVMPNIPRAAWGNGSFEVEGNGSISEPRLVYSYRVDPCYDPQFNPNCPGYTVTVPDIPETDTSLIYNVLDDENVNTDYASKEANEELVADEEQRKKEEAEEELKRKYRLEKQLSVTDAAALFAENRVIAQMNELANKAVLTSGYYKKDIPGNEYNDMVALEDSKLPENRRGLRNGFAQQLLHQKMIDSQYK